MSNGLWEGMSLHNSGYMCTRICWEADMSVLSVCVLSLVVGSATMELSNLVYKTYTTLKGR